MRKLKNDAFGASFDNGGRVLVKGKCSALSSAENLQRLRHTTMPPSNSSQLLDETFFIRDGIIRDQTALENASGIHQDVMPSMISDNFTHHPSHLAL